MLTVKLGFIDTRLTYGLETAIPVAKPEDAASAIVRAQRKKKTRLFYPSFWGPVMGLIRAIPSTVCTAHALIPGKEGRHLHMDDFDFVVFRVVWLSLYPRLCMNSRTLLPHGGVGTLRLPKQEQ